MTKPLSWICLVLLICLGGSARAEKPKLAVLGLEVTAGPGGVVDPTTTQIAKEITRELRQRAQSGASPFVIAPNSNKELTDEKLLMSCDNEAKECMAVIGAGLAADKLLYGRVEKKGELYRVQLKLLDVKTKTIETGSDEMPVGAAPTGVSRRLYTKLVGDSPNSVGTLVVVARSQAGGPITGRVLVDEDRKGELVGGKLSLSGIGEGRHVVAIEAGGFQRFEEAVTVRGGQQAKLDAQLTERAVVGAVSAPTSSSHARLWKVSFGASLGVAVLGVGAAVLGAVKQNSANDKLLPVPVANSPVPKAEMDKGISVEDCGTDPKTLKTQRGLTFNAGEFKHACNWHKVNVAGFVAMGVGGVGALVSLIMLTRDSGGEAKTATATRRTRPEVAIAPIVSPEMSGASMSIRW